MDLDELKRIIDDRLAQRIGMDITRSENGFSLEKMYQVAGKEDRVINVSFRPESSSAQIWGADITCCLQYSERDRLQLEANIEHGDNHFGMVRAHYLLYEWPKELIDKLEKEGFDSRDVVEIQVGPLLYPENVYNGANLRKLNTIDIPLEPDTPLNELKFDLWVLNHFRNDGMILTPAENNDFIALRLLFGIPLAAEEEGFVFDENHCIYNNDVARQFLFYKSRLSPLSREKQSQQLRLEKERLLKRLVILDNQLKNMGTNLEKLKKDKNDIYSHILLNMSMFKEVRLNSTGKYPVFLDYEGYIHIGLRHITEWQFCDFFAERAMFQLKEDEVIPMLKRVVDAINEDYQDKKEQRPDFLYRKFGKNSLYLNGDYYMIHIGKSGRIENFSKSVDKSYTTKRIIRDGV